MDKVVTSLVALSQFINLLLSMKKSKSGSKLLNFSLSAKEQREVISSVIDLLAKLGYDLSGTSSSDSNEKRQQHWFTNNPIVDVKRAIRKIRDSQSVGSGKVKELKDPSQLIKDLLKADELDSIHDLIDITIRPNDDLSEQIRILSSIFTDNHLTMKYGLASQYRYEIDTWFGKDVKIRIFDHTYYCYDFGLWIKRSSINIDLHGDKELPVKFERILESRGEISSVFRTQRFFSSVRGPLEERPDWITFCQPEYLIHRHDSKGNIYDDVGIFLSINNPFHVFNSNVIGYYKACDRRARALDTIIRLWYKGKRTFMRQRRSPAKDIHFQVMLIYYLQKCGVLPDLDQIDASEFNVYLSQSEQPIAIEGGVSKMSKLGNNTHEVKSESNGSDNLACSNLSLGDLLIGFFKFYLNEFDYKNKTVSICPQHDSCQQAFVAPTDIKKLVVMDPYRASPMVLVEHELNMFLELLNEDYTQLSESEILASIL